MAFDTFLKIEKGTCALSALCGVYWSKWFGAGPLERVMRWAVRA